MPQCEFSNEQNALLGSLASKMRFVGLFFVVVGVLNILVVLAVYRDQVPQSRVEKLPAEAKAQVGKSKGQLPSNNHSGESPSMRR